MNSLINTLGKNNPAQMIQQIRNNPLGFLAGKGFNIPQGMSDPNAIINHLVSSGQIPQQRYNQVMQMVGQMKR